MLTRLDIREEQVRWRMLPTYIYYCCSTRCAFRRMLFMSPANGVRLVSCTSVGVLVECSAFPLRFVDCRQLTFLPGMHTLLQCWVSIASKKFDVRKMKNFLYVVSAAFCPPCTPWHPPALLNEKVDVSYHSCPQKYKDICHSISICKQFLY